MAQDHGSRIVVCSKHGLPYDASKRGGCAQCIREWKRQRETATTGGGIPTAVKMLILVLVAAGVYLYLGRSREGGENTLSAPAPAAAAADAAAQASEVALREIIGDLPNLIQVGRAQTESYLSDTGEEDRRRDDWEFWTVDWNGRVQKLADRLPAAPDSRENLKLALVFQDVSSALAELRSVPQATQDALPVSAEVGKRLEAAERSLRQARLHLAQLHR